VTWHIQHTFNTWQPQKETAALLRTMLSFDVATTPPGAARLRMPVTAVGEEPLNNREYSGTPMKLDAFNRPDKSDTDGPRDGVAKGLGAETWPGAARAGASLDNGARDHAEATSMIFPTTETSSSCLSACRSCSSSCKDYWLRYT
jgi:hypothetical protein